MPLVNTYLHIVATRFEAHASAQGVTRSAAWALHRGAARASKLAELFASVGGLDVITVGLRFLGSTEAVHRQVLFAGEARCVDVVHAGKDHRSIAEALTVLWEERHGPHTLERDKPLMLHHAAAAWAYAKLLAAIRLASGEARVAAWTKARLRLRERGAAGITGEGPAFVYELERMQADGENPHAVDLMAECPETDAELDAWSTDLETDRAAVADLAEQARVLHEASQLGHSPEASRSTPAWWRGPLLILGDAVQTAPGDYASRPLTVDEARWAVRESVDVVPGIVDDRVAIVAGDYLGRTIAPCTERVTQEVGQHAIVCRIPQGIGTLTLGDRYKASAEAVAGLGIRFEVMTRLS